MKKLLVSILSLSLLWWFAMAAWTINQSDVNNQSSCAADLTKDISYYIKTGLTRLPSDIFSMEDYDAFISPSNSSVQIWRNGVIGWCNDWYRWSNAVKAGDASGAIVLQNEDGCTFTKPNGLKTWNKSTQIDAQIHYTVWYFEWWWENTLTSRFYYKNSDTSPWRCYPNWNAVTNINSCPPVTVNYKQPVKQHTWECLNYRIFRCGDWLVNSPYSPNGTTYTNSGNFYEQCDPNDPNHTNWWVGGCTSTCQRNDTPTGPVCGNGTIEAWEECEFSVWWDSPRMWWKGGNGTLELSQLWPSNSNLWCDANCQLKPVSCTLSSSPIQQLVGQPITFTATKDNWTSYTSLDFWDNTNVVQNPTFPINHTYSIAWNFQPTLTVTNNYSGTIRTGISRPTATCVANTNGVNIGGVVWFDLKKVLDYMSGDIVHYTITLTNTWNIVANNAYIKDTVPSAVTYLTSSIAWIWGQRPTYSFNIWEENWTTIFVYTWLTLNPGQSVVVSFTWQIDTWEIINTTVWEALSDKCSDGVKMQVERSFWVIYDAQTQNCAETSGNIVICEDMPKPMILKQQKVWATPFTHDNVQVNPWNTISYKIYFWNSSSGEVHGVKIEDYLPRCIQYINSSIYWVQWAVFNTWTTPLWSTKITYDQFALNWWQTWYILVTWKIKDTPDCIHNTSYTNKAYIYFTNKTKYDKVKAQREEDDGWTIRKEADKQYINEWENITYTITYRNTWDIAWQPWYTLTDTWPENLDYIWDSCNGVCTKTVSNWEYIYTVNESLEWWDSRQLILTWKVTQCPEWWMIVNKVKLEFGREDGTSGEVEWVSVVICGSWDDGWTIRKEADKTLVNSLDEITYTISYRNTWSIVRNSYRIEDEWPAQHLTYKSDSCAGWCTKSVNWNIYTYSMAWSLPAWWTWRLILTN